MNKRLLVFSLIFVFFSLLANAQQTTKVRGLVVEAETDEPIIGALIQVKGTTIGAQTNIEGRFEISVPSSAKTLVVSYVGMTKEEVAIKPNMRIALKSDTKALDEVIVVAFGKMKKSAFTGSAVQINADQIQKRQVSNVMSALAGSVPGVNIVNGNNQPGMSPSVSVRGIGSFSASSAPLYIVDGVPFSGDISAINPQDIESTTILKDAASAALYGARGANGVILIQTKDGKKSEGSININVEARYGFNQLGVPNYDVITSPEVYATKFFESLYNNNASIQRLSRDPHAIYDASISQFFSDSKGLGYPVFNNPSGEPLFLPNDRGIKINGVEQPFFINPNATVGNIYRNSGGTYFLQPDDWTKATFHTNPRQEYTLSVSGRNDKANYYLSAGYLDDKGYLKGSRFNRFTSRLRSDFRPFSWMKIGGSLAYTRYSSDNLSDLGSTTDGSNILAITNFIAPLYPIYVRDGDGNILIDRWGRKTYDFGNNSYPGLKRPYLALANPLASQDLDIQRDNADIMNFNGDIDFNILDGLKATLNLGYNVDNTYSTGRFNPYYGLSAESGGGITKAFGRQSSLNLQQLLTYSKNFDRHHFDFLAGHEFFSTQMEHFTGSKLKLFYPSTTELNGAILSPETNSSKNQYATEGYIGRLLYDYNNKYFAQLSFRRDASSRFARENRWGNFGSISGSWLVTNETFMKQYRNYVNYLKLKLSYGLQGNDNIGAFRYTDLYTLSNSNDNFSIQFQSKGNRSVTWETSKSWNLGVEFGLFKDLVVGSVEVYTRGVDDMLFFRTVPTELGYSGYYDNMGSIRNTGIEFSLTGNLIRSKNLNWQVSVNGSYFKNKITALPEEWAKVKGGYRMGTSVYRVGGSRYEVAYLKYEGLNEEGEALYQYYNPETKTYEKSTDFKKIESESPVESKVIYNLAPKLRGGFSSSVDYRGFDLSLSCSYSLGGRAIDSSYATLMHGGDQGRNWHKDILKSWSPKNTSTNIPKVKSDANYAPNILSDRFLISNNYLSINSLSLGYTLPASWFKKTKYNIKSMRFYLVGDNLWVFSARKGYDPRFGSGTGYKAMRSYSAGVRFSL